MIKLILISLSAASFTYSQNINSGVKVLHQKENIIKFADYLFCEKDYLRSANEYLRIDEGLRDEKINFKIALSFSTIGDYSTAKNIFRQINESSPYYGSSRLEIMKIFFLEERYHELGEYFRTGRNLNLSTENTSGEKLYSLSFLKDQQTIPAFENFVKAFDADEKNEVAALYQLKMNPPNKNPLIASVLSAIIPGAGKIYTGDIGDGIFTFLTTGVFTFLAYDNFKAEHNFRGWLFSGLAVMFYGGNIYGSFASAQIHNARIKYEFNLQLDSFIKLKNYFIPQYDFCK
ncbi:MAG: hypothetical protein A2W11_01770 [Ignavibacteria bacterium RBG_16_35_7]|nr:MAG: hypothetical protein A2W11_01770 [Ignavibacteria bacterium RBG_16_35_7]